MFDKNVTPFGYIDELSKSELKALKAHTQVTNVLADLAKDDTEAAYLLLDDLKDYFAEIASIIPDSSDAYWEAYIKLVNMETKGWDIEERLDDKKRDSEEDKNCSDAVKMRNDIVNKISDLLDADPKEGLIILCAITFMGNDLILEHNNLSSDKDMRKAAELVKKSIRGSVNDK